MRYALAFIAVLILAATTARAEMIETRNLRVIDGDTIAIGSTVYRLVGFDAPESGERASCASEAVLALRATSRLRAIIARDGIELERIACSCLPGTEGTRACNYGRRCGVLRAKGRDVAEIMIDDGLAHRYVCGPRGCPRRETWCP